MRLDRAARLERLLDRHLDVRQVIGTGGETLIRKDQLLVSAADADAVHASTARWVARRDDAAAPGVSVFHLRPEAKIDVLELTEGLSGGARHKVVNAGPNHIMMAGPMWGGGPFDDPTPAEDVPPAPSPASVPRTPQPGHESPLPGRPVTVGPCGRSSRRPSARSL